MFFIDASFLFRFLPCKVLYRVRDNRKSIFFTFDDGPHPDSTPVLLELLERYQIQATFFCVGQNVEKYPNLYETIVQSGHAIGNHTFHHLDAWKVSFRRYIDDVQKAQALLNTKLFRPPYGHLTFRVLNYLKDFFSIVLWTNMPGDFCISLTPEKFQKRILRSRHHSGSILVLHDKPQTISILTKTLPEVIQAFRMAGYQFCILDETALQHCAC